MAELDSFAAKNAASARNWYTTNETSTKSEFNQKKRNAPAAPKIGKCDKCHEEKEVRAFRVRETAIMNGAATFGTVVKHYCEDCAPKNRNEKDAPEGPNAQAIKNLRRSMKKLLK